MSYKKQGVLIKDKQVGFLSEKIKGYMDKARVSEVEIREFYVNENRSENGLGRDDLVCSFIRMKKTMGIY